MAGTIGVRLHVPGGCCHPSLRPAPRGDMGRRIRGDAARAARRRDHLCGGGRSSPPGAEGGTQGRSRRLCWHSYEQHPELPLSAAVGRAAARIGRQGLAVAALRRSACLSWIEWSIACLAGKHCKYDRCSQSTVYFPALCRTWPASIGTPAASCWIGDHRGFSAPRRCRGGLLLTENEPIGRNVHGHQRSRSPRTGLTVGPSRT
jgi:hypothetical protein